ncbi:MAG: tyrosine-type recombinase/integrase, partial [Actinophytocola sp.]|nr:tyrosine-type recombinase/integrase [Actinophytocola sp.]
LGLRRGEVAGLRLDDIDWRAGELTVVGKGNRLERLPLPAEPGEAIVAWLTDGRPECETRSVFTTLRPPGRPLSPGAIGHVVGSACQSAGLGAHRLRHTLATAMLRAGASLPEVGQVLRHRSARSTAIYAKVDEVALRPLARPWPGTTPGAAESDDVARSLARPWPGASS